MQKRTISELKALCKERGLKSSGKSKGELMALLEPKEAKEAKEPKESPKESAAARLIHDQIHTADTLQILPLLPPDSAQIILIDPPYNIGKDFGNDSDKRTLPDYLVWCDQWIAECLRILKPNGTMFIYGFSEVLALILARIPMEIHRRWIIWHYTNKAVPSLNFWQRSHESILVLWKSDKVFHRDEVREPYTDGFLNGAAGKQRKATKGRFSKGETVTEYKAHEGGALPRDVIKIPALAGGAGMKERVDHPTQKPLALCEKMLRSCMQDNGYVLIPFAGSGSECVAAKKLGLPFVAIEINPVYVELIMKRISEAVSETISEVANEVVSEINDERKEENEENELINP